MKRVYVAFALIVTAMGFAGCSELHVASHVLKKETAPACLPEGYVKVGNPYIIDGKRYSPLKSSFGYRERGIASWYGKDFHGKATANGECYNMYAFTAAHKTLPLPTVVRVTNLENNRSVVLKVNDRGPYVGTRVIDLSYAAAQSLDIARNGTAPVLVEAIGGPHYHVDGAAGLLAEQKRKGGVDSMPPAAVDFAVPPLATVVPSTIEGEDLAPLTKIARVDKATAALPPPADPDNLPPVPDKFEQPYASAVPLEHSAIFVQTGAYSSKMTAEGQLNRLKNVSGRGLLAPLNSASDGQTLWRVRSGPYHSVAEAEEALADIKQAGFDNAMIKVEKE